MTDYITTGEILEKYPNVKRNRLMYALQNGKIKGTKRGWMWLVELTDFKRWARQEGYM